MWIACQPDDSQEMSTHFYEKIITNIECRLLQIVLGALS